ncbi:hypothetical protein LguiA_029137 [Lonicera macranthoides]
MTEDNIRVAYVTTKVTQSTPVKWDVVAWHTLLNACHVHQNYGLEKQVAPIVLHRTS